jgi:MFS family permease
MTLPSLVLATLSVGAIGLGAGMLIRKRSRRFLGLAWITVGIAMAMALLNPASLLLRMRLVLGFLSFVVLMITLEAVRRFAMEERYALLWVFTGIILVGFAVYPDAVGWLAKTTGMHYVSAITVVVFAFLLMVAFHFSLALSGLRENQKKLSQKSAELELRLSELEKQKGGGTPSA